MEVFEASEDRQILSTSINQAGEDSSSQVHQLNQNEEIVQEERESAQLISAKMTLMNHHKTNKLKKIAGWLFAAVIASVLLVLLMKIKGACEQQQRPYANDKQNPQEISRKPNFPHILWILTQRAISHSRLEPTFYGYHMHRYAQKSGFTTRFVDHQTAYRWLSPSTQNIITKAMHRRRYEVNVGEFLRIALIIEHGGIILRPGTAFFIQNFDWLRTIFEEGTVTEQPNLLECRLNYPAEVFMFTDKNRYLDFFIAGQKNAPLLWQVFLQMSEAVQSNKQKYLLLKGIQIIDRGRNTTTLRNFFETFVNSYIVPEQRLTVCTSWKLQSIEMSKSMGQVQSCTYDFDVIMKLDKQTALKQCGFKFMVGLGGLNDKLSQMFRSAIAGGSKSIGKFHKKSMIAEDFFYVEGIKQYLEPLSKSRTVYICIVSLKIIPKTLVKQEIQQSLRKLKMQSFSKWKAVYFVQEGFEKIEKDQSLIIVSASEYEGLNLQRAVTRHCPPKSIIFLLDYDQSVTSTKFFNQIQKSFSDLSVYGAFVPLQINSTLIAPTKITSFRRIQFKPNILELETIANHFRVFYSDYYRLISHNDLHNVEGEYYDRTIPLLAMLEMSIHMEICRRDNDIFQIKRMKKIIDFPEKSVTLTFTIATEEYKVIDGSRDQYNFKFNYLSFCTAVKLKTNNDNWLWLGDEMLVFNTGQEYQSPAQRQQMPKIIPRKIHQIWVYGEPTPAKKYMMNELKLFHPGFEYFVWSKQNITVENFPHTFDIIQTLFELDKVSPFSKMAMISDFMRLQIIYQHGGFYFDTNYLWLGKGSLEDWLSYELVMSGELYPRMHLVASNSFFGSYAKNPRFLRLLSPQCINRVNIYEKHAGLISGPGFIKRLINGKEEQNDPNTLKPSMQELYPIYPFDEMTSQNRCRIKLGSNSTEGLMFTDKEYGFTLNCSEAYPSAYGIDFYELGGSWIHRK